MNDRISTTDELVAEVRRLDIPEVALGGANWIVELIDDDEDEFDSAGEFVDVWADASHLPDEQMGWILANGFSDDWAAPILERIETATAAGDPVRTTRLLDLLSCAGRQRGQPPVILGASGGRTPTRPPIIALTPAAPAPRAPGSAGTPPTDSPPIPRSVPGADIDAARSSSDAVDSRRFQVSRDPDVVEIVQFEFSERDVDNLPVAGDDTLLTDLIPDDGLQTRWIVSSSQPLSSVDADTRVQNFVGDDAVRWAAEFELTIPKIGDSEIRRLRCDGDDHQLLDVRIYTIGFESDLLRHLMVTLGPPDADADIDEDAVVDIRDTIDPPHHEFTTPPDNVLLTVGDGFVYVSHGAAPLETAYWPSAAELSGPIDTLRSKAEAFRSAHSAHLDDIDADELARRVEHDLDTYYLGRTQNWGWDTYQDIAVDPALQAAWEIVASSDEALDLAYYGYALYTTFFPEDGPVRPLLDSLPAGSRINVDWPVDAGNASVPWNLMYTAPPAKPIDAEQFFGLRFRCSWAKWRRAPASQVLGKANEAERLHVLYWERDEIGTEADHQRDQAQDYPTHRVVPNPATLTDTPALQQAIAELTAPTTAAVLHFYCHCVHDTTARETKLIFGPVQRLADFKVSGPDFGVGRFAGEPLVFVNACESTGSDAYEVNQLEQMFFRRGCRAFLGTEIKVPIALAARFAHVFFALLEEPLDDGRLFAGEAAAQARRYLWLNYRNIGGLFYSYIHHYGLRMEP